MVTNECGFTSYVPPSTAGASSNVTMSSGELREVSIQRCQRLPDAGFRDGSSNLRDPRQALTMTWKE